MSPPLHPNVSAGPTDSTHFKGHRDPFDLADLVAGLWREAPFARLPDDAPAELQQLVRDVDNPHRVYMIHRACRRHDIQLLVDRYVFQLRQGCGSPHCSTPTCFTCRKRLAGKAPLRRYNPTSARTLAVYLAGQDSPERGLCPFVRRGWEPPAATNTIVFSAHPASLPLKHSEAPVPGGSGRKASHVSSQGSASRASATPLSSHLSPSLPSPRPSSSSPRNSGSFDGSRHGQTSPGGSHGSSSSKLTMHEQSGGKDYRSFAVATFGTVAFKMLEWLTPQGINYISRELSEAGRPESTPDAASNGNDQSAACEPGSSNEHPREKQAPEPASSELPLNLSKQDDDSSTLLADSDAPPSPPRSPAKTSSKTTPSRRRRHSRGSFRASSPPNSNLKGSLDALPIANPKEEAKQPQKSTSLTGFHLDTRTRTARIAPSVITRGLAEVPLKPAVENVPRPNSPSTGRTGEQPLATPDASDAGGNTSADSHSQPDIEKAITPARRGSHDTPSYKDSSQLDLLLPQSLRYLNLDLVEFICDVFQEERTAEKHFFGPFQSSEPCPNLCPSPKSKSRRLVRRPRPGQKISRAQWKSFNEQTLFDVLSDPRSLVRSFTCDGKLYDSHTLWYCMLRMTRAAPSLVLHSLWLAARSLFAPPECLRNVRSHTKPLFDGISRSVSAFEAGCVMSICLHALVAAVPCVADSKTLYEMSNVRSHGLGFSGNKTAVRQPAATCLAYDDVFSNDIALRLARRLFCAITAREGFAEIAKCQVDKAGHAEEDLDILRPLLDQLDIPTANPAHNMVFSAAERLLHEARVPTLLLDWARAVLLQEWDGRADFSCDGPFYGALCLMASLFKNKSTLLLNDAQFRVDCISDELESMETPVQWLEFTSTRQRRHLLDYPYLFNPDALVTWFRAINFSKMSRRFEEAGSLKSRIHAIVEPGSMVKNRHHTNVLQEMLKRASSRYLVLDISRERTVMDAFDQLWRREERELSRPLKIHLGEDEGEEGYDSGGVQQEFFRLAIAECLDPDYGAFTIDERTRAAWFVPGSLVEDWKFEMIGLLFSLAIYNGLTLSVTFPKALYRKLLGRPVDQLYHIADGWPALANGLTKLLEWDEKDGLVEDVFVRTYEFSVESFGTDVTRQMIGDDESWPQGQIPLPRSQRTRAGESPPDEAPPVTNANRDEYVKDYVRYLTDVSVRPQYLAFERGFRACFGTKALSLLTPPILQSMVEGVQTIDVSELRSHARHVGWDISHRTVRDFWSIVKRFDDRMKRKLLEFVTASDRVPVGGMANLQFVVQKNGEVMGEGGHLPTAYTCYGILLLPEYEDKETMRERLCMALENSEGFGFA